MTVCERPVVGQTVSPTTLRAPISVLQPLIARSLSPLMQPLLVTHNIQQQPPSISHGTRGNELLAEKTDQFLNSLHSLPHDSGPQQPTSKRSKSSAGAPHLHEGPRVQVAESLWWCCGLTLLGTQKSVARAESEGRGGCTAECTPGGEGKHRVSGDFWRSLQEIRRSQGSLE